MENRQSNAHLAYVIDQYPPSQIQNDEISLFDVWQVLVKHRSIIWGSLALCFLFAGGFYLLKPLGFDVMSTLQVGSLHYDDKGQSVLIENTQDSLEKIKSAFVPLVIAEFKQNNPSTLLHYAIDATIPKGTNLISLKINGCKATDEDVCTFLINRVVEKIRNDHAKTTDLSKKNLEVKLASAENTLKSTQDELNFIAGKKRRLLKTAELLTSQLKNKQRLLVSTLANRTKITATTAAGAMLALQIDNEIKRNQELVDSLEQRLTIGINQEQDELNKAEKDTARLQDEQENIIGQIKNQILSINNTQAVTPALMSDKPTGISFTLLMSAALMSGLFLGIIAAFICEFIEKAQTQQQKLST
jgi:hypothetical protein